MTPGSAGSVTVDLTVVGIRDRTQIVVDTWASKYHRQKDRPTGVAGVDQVGLLATLYRPNTADGNYQGDVSSRGGNDMLRRVLVKLGHTDEQGADELFNLLDAAAYWRGERSLAKVNAEAVAEAEAEAKGGEDTRDA
jgi:hypothetical protein